ncbi:MAG: hypothetical protein AAB214_03285 [Fibrobacterota bacterium]
MRTSNGLILSLGFLCLSACAGLKSANLAPNTINEPVFHKDPDIAFGISRTQWNDPATGKDSNDGAFNLNLRANFPVNEWAGFSYLPVYWTFLLSGEQYKDNTHLRVGKLNLALAGGIAGFSYSSSNGLKFPAALGLHAKYLFDEFFYANSVISTEFTNVSDLHNGHVSGCLGVGSQLTETIAIVATAQINRVFASPFHYFDMHGVQVYNGGITTNTSMAFDWYPTPKHNFSASVTHFDLLDSGNPASRWLFSGQYSYVFGGH